MGKPGFEEQTEIYLQKWDDGWDNWGYVVDEQAWICSACYDAHMSEIKRILYGDPNRTAKVLVNVMKLIGLGSEVTPEEVQRASKTLYGDSK